MKTFFSLTIFGLILCMVSACNSQADESTSGINARPGVTLGAPAIGTIADSVDLISHVRFLDKNILSAPFNGYIKEVLVQPGATVKKGQVLLKLDSKEARALAEVSTNEQLGSVTIKASSDGQIVNLSHFTGDFVQEGTVLAEIAKPGEQYLEIYVPFQYRSFIHKNLDISVQLPGHSGFRSKATVLHQMSSADVPSQTAVYLAKLKTPEMLPEGLMLTSRLQTKAHENALIIPKEAILANEELTAFWVMQIMNDSLAVKVPIRPGISTDEKVDVLNTSFKTGARLVISGQYGLEDSTVIHIQKP